MRSTYIYTSKAFVSCVACCSDLTCRPERWYVLRKWMLYHGISRVITVTERRGTRSHCWLYKAFGIRRTWIPMCLMYRKARYVWAQLDGAHVATQLRAANALVMHVYMSRHNNMVSNNVQCCRHERTFSHVICSALPSLEEDLKDRDLYGLHVHSEFYSCQIVPHQDTRMFANKGPWSPSLF
jgi:hypothetical protein